MVGVLVHIEGQDRNAPGRGLSVIARILIDEPAIKPFAIATNSLRQRSTDPKSRVNA
jgi:hypothetical protein